MPEFLGKGKNKRKSAANLQSKFQAQSAGFDAMADAQASGACGSNIVRVQPP